MARPIVLGNGELHVGINNYGLVHDFHFPYVGLENHTIGRGLRHRVGVWVDGHLSWLDDGSWDVQFSYPHQSLVGHVRARNDHIGVLLEFDDAVDSDLNVFIRSVHVINRLAEERDIRLYMHQAFVIGDSRGNTDTAQYLPDTDAIMHYRGRRVFIVAGEVGGKPFDQHTVGLFGIEGHEGSWRDAEDGQLSGSSVEHGRVDSVLGFSLHIAAHSSERVSYWISAGTNMRSALQAHNKLRENGIDHHLEKTAHWWHKWLEPTRAAAQQIPEEWRQQFIISAMILRSHMDNRGAVIASTDSGMLNYNRDAYAYCWPRDGAYVIWPLMRLGYTAEPMRFFDFCRRVMHPKGYLSHKYRSDGALGSSWHTYLHETGVAPPIQTDETALVLFVFVQYYHQHQSDKLLHEYYSTFVEPMANFLASYVDEQTHLPQPSYDLWEEQFMVTTYTTSVTYAALSAAAELAEAAHDEASAVAWRSAAEDMYKAARERFYSHERECLRKGIRHHPDHVENDDAIDMSALFGAFMFGLYGADETEIVSSFQTAAATFEQQQRIALPRYEHDAYRRVSDHAASNYWHITTLWYAQYLIERGEKSKAKEIIDWSHSHSYGSGIMAEQIQPHDQLSTSVAPLAWSHAEFMATLLDYSALEMDDTSV
jgi:GH15 family glucan-1,4-alpha-glucosidase